MTTAYARALAQPSDIQEHLGFLHGLACLSPGGIVEIGVRKGLSTAALCASRNKVTSYDIDKCEPHATMLRVEYSNWTFHHKSSLEVEIPECDLLFIDGEHKHDTVLAELRRHASRARKWIVLHDTHTFAKHDKGGGGKGLKPAIDTFIEEDAYHTGSFERLFAFPHNNGLTVLERRW